MQITLQFDRLAHSNQWECQHKLHHAKMIDPYEIYYDI